MSAPEGRLVNTSLVHAGMPGVRLENDELSLSIFPDAGGKILDLVHKPTHFNLLATLGVGGVLETGVVATVLAHVDPRAEGDRKPVGTAREGSSL
jgi:hypothetical protein